ncbi:MAG: hypothetical protein E6J34_23500 [Chloroflexi bacterium]|nr:MAG: hypothetical protein E6J34_23500 [Chloroflexota bacterium]
MDLSKDEMKRACEVAVLYAEKYKARLLPARPVGLKAEEGFVCELVFLGVDGDILGCKVTLQWTYWTVSATTGRAYRAVHVQLRCLTKDSGRVLQFAGLHEPQYEGATDRCLRCPGGFHEQVMIKKDTTLHEF